MKDKRRKFIVPFVLLMFFYGCGNDNQKHYYYHQIAVANFYDYSYYLESLQAVRTSPGIPSFVGDYPENTRITINNSSRLVIRKDFWIPYSESGPARRRFGSFMYDGFMFPKDDEVIQYISNGKWYILDSIGFDKRYEQSWLDSINMIKDQLSTQTLHNLIALVQYDPTNGALSQGDLIVASYNLGYPASEMYAKLDKAAKQGMTWR